MMRSSNYETQLFAIKHLSDSFYDTNSTLIFSIIANSSPLIRIYIFNKKPLPFSSMDKNKEFASFIPNLIVIVKVFFISE
jgi:hypothetical protein